MVGLAPLTPKEWPYYEPGLNRAAFVGQWRDGKTAPQLSEMFGLSYTEVEHYMNRYQGVTIWTPKGRKRDE